MDVVEVNYDINKNYTLFNELQIIEHTEKYFFV